MYCVEKYDEAGKWVVVYTNKQHALADMKFEELCQSGGRFRIIRTLREYPGHPEEAK